MFNNSFDLLGAQSLFQPGFPLSRATVQHPLKRVETLQLQWMGFCPRFDYDRVNFQKQLGRATANLASLNQAVGYSTLCRRHVHCIKGKLAKGRARNSTCSLVWW